MRLIPFGTVFLTLFSLSAQALEQDGSASYAKLLHAIAAEDGVRWNKFGSAEKKWLDETMAWLKNAQPGAAEKNEQLAFWVNAHNVCVMKLISDHLPIDDVMKIQGFRDRLTCEIVGAPRTLIDLESGVIRPLFQDPRVHFILWWGVRGSPRLLAVPYDAKTIETHLSQGVERAIRNPNYVRIEKDAKKVTLSPIFDWYKYDFGPKDTDVLTFIRSRLPKGDAKHIPKKYSQVAFATFDWTLDQSKN
ncbi:MAG TPA: DUF547 domain-containing protein [Bdellovibrionota bacterium]|nr:DUF547 domain-containing protein [Bdellovibrionota bacterium]